MLGEDLEARAYRGAPRKIVNPLTPRRRRRALMLEALLIQKDTRNATTWVITDQRSPRARGELARARSGVGAAADETQIVPCSRRELSPQHPQACSVEPP